MKSTVRNTLFMLLSTATTALAASGAREEENGFLLMLFLGFGALVIAFQFVPGVMMFFSMVKGLFTGSKKPAIAGKHQGMK